MSPLDLTQKLTAHFPGWWSDPVEFRGEVTLRLSDAEHIADVCAYAKRELGFDYLVDITGIDNYGDDPRFTLVYELHALAARSYLRLKTDVSEEQGEIPSVTGVWRTADWHEREVYDMLGIRFRGHPDLRRILMWDGYPHFPLRKDFPLAGKPTQLPDVAFTEPAPMEGGPFVTIAGGKDTVDREPRVRHPEADTLASNSRLERRADVRPAHGRAYGPGAMKPND
ncbi:MAG: NADH-quinone oxidoreductase subunit C [Verrucomicrobiota bacterium]